MNSRLEGGQMTLPTTQAVIDTVKSWCREEDAEVSDDAKGYYFDGIKDAAPEGKDQYISYWVEDDWSGYERKIYFPDKDDVSRIKNALIIDDKVKEYLDPDAVADFIYNCIDVNALGSVQHIALLYDEPILNEDGCIEDWKETKGRQELMDRASDGCDEYALEVGLENLGINWVERSAVIINVGNIVDAAKEAAEMFAEDYYGDKNEWRKEFQKEFEIALVSTICHEFRHSVYEMNEFTPKDGSDPNYPALGGEEDAVEEYGNREMERLRSDPKARLFIEEMIQIKGDEKVIDKSPKKPQQGVDR